MCLQYDIVYNFPQCKCCTDDIWKTSFQSYDMQVTSNTPAAGTCYPLQSILKQIVPMSGYTPVVCYAQH